MLPFHLGGRLGAGLLLGYAGLPWLPPFAMFGDAFRALAWISTSEECPKKPVGWRSIR